MVNRWNFIRFKEITTPISTLSSLDLSEFDDLYRLPVYVGDTLSFYVNFDTLISIDTDDWGISIYDCDFNRVSNDLGLSVDTVTGVFKNLYASFTIPSLSRYDNYYLVIHDQYLQTAYYISNPLRNIGQREKEDLTYVIEYSHSTNIYNFYYENVPTFTNRFRIHLNISKPQGKRTLDGYSLIDGSFKPVRGTFNRTSEFVTLWFDEFAHDAFMAMTEHDNIIIDSKNWRLNDNDEYQYEWNENYKYSEGIIRLDDTAYAISNKLC